MTMFKKVGVVDLISNEDAAAALQLNANEIRYILSHYKFGPPYYQDPRSRILYIERSIFDLIQVSSKVAERDGAPRPFLHASKKEQEDLSRKHMKVVRHLVGAEFPRVWEGKSRPFAILRGKGRRQNPYYGPIAWPATDSPALEDMMTTPAPTDLDAIMAAVSKEIAALEVRLRILAQQEAEKVFKSLFRRASSLD